MPESSRSMPQRQEMMRHGLGSQRWGRDPSSQDFTHPWAEFQKRKGNDSGKSSQNMTCVAIHQ